ncbi:uncharacterized protein LOC6556463 [Drosophila grimshawi]|uniref:GH16606 n=1 Tax=Drosophila grimshawi TaxID=7222 RepID=B4J278_DROGR|nr:uncharacterized protein LOC6556463 [Drosophila grimshawi]EDV97029.1 GH16606 [Drosophila grimshawi]
MGCASSTPMVATAGSEMLKAATHVASDVKKQGEAAVEDATQAIGATVDTAKETVSTAVAGITNELGTAFKDGTDALDEVKHKVMEGLHLETKADANADTDAKHVATSASRAPTPALDGDADSLKTSTPEPEIERALANSADNEEEAPPTPKPSLQEMAELSTQVGSEATAAVAATVAATVVASTEETAATTVAATVEDSSQWDRSKDKEEEEQRRPNTTEWEKFADQLAKSRKFRPYESFARTKNQFSVYKDYTSMRDKPGHRDGHFSDGNSMSSASQSQSDLSSGHLTPAPPTRRGHRDYAKFVGSEQPGSVSRASSRLSNVGGTTMRTFDFNPHRERISLPITSRAGAGRVGSALNGRRSLWAREQPAVLPEEPLSTYSPVRRRSMVAGFGHRAIREVHNIQPARSTSHLSILPKKKETTASKPLIEPIRPQVFGNNAKPIKSSIKAGKEERPSEMFKSLFNSSSDISTALLLATPLTVTSLLRSPSAAAKSHTEHASAGFNKMPSPLASRAASFIAEPAETRRHSKSTVTQATPTITPSRLNAEQLPAALRSASIDTHEERRLTLPKTNTTPTATPQKVVCVQRTPSRTQPRASSIYTTSNPKTKSPSISRASSRLSSNSSTEIVIRPLSHLNTPSAASLSPDQVVMTEYDDSDLEAALARLADWRGSTTTLHSMRSSNSQMERISNPAVLLDSRRTSPWIRRKADRKEMPIFSGCGIVELTSPAKTAHELLERCEICCNEFVMK